jgi:hypothetical protein
LTSPDAGGGWVAAAATRSHVAAQVISPGEVGPSWSLGASSHSAVLLPLIVALTIRQVATM